MEIQRKYDIAYSFFKTTSEYFDSIEIHEDGIDIVFNNETIEQYSNTDLAELIPSYFSSKH